MALVKFFTHILVGLSHVWNIYGMHRQYSTAACGCYQDSESSSEHKVSIALFRT